VSAGEIVGLIGPNGAGKSTLFNCVAGDSIPTRGRIAFDGADLTRASPEAHARAGIGRPFQIPATFEDMTILENVMVGGFLRHPRREARDRALEVIEVVRLNDPTHRRARLARQAANGLKSPGCSQLNRA
jgi:branched-chain amino acid transport system ATP-binding protein